MGTHDVFKHLQFCQHVARVKYYYVAEMVFAKAVDFNITTDPAVLFHTETFTNLQGEFHFIIPLVMNICYIEIAN